MYAAGQDPCLHGRPVRGRAHHLRARDALVQRLQHAPARLVPPGQPGEAYACAEGGHVVGCIAGASWNHYRRVVAENQDRRLARDALHASVDELVGDEVSDHGHAARREAINERDQPDGVDGKRRRSACHRGQRTAAGAARIQ